MAIPYFWVDKNVGGQAVIEGVMMRSPAKISTSVRQPNGEIVTQTEPFISLTKKVKILGWPVIRGMVSFFEILKFEKKPKKITGKSGPPKKKKK